MSVKTVEKLEKNMVTMTVEVSAEDFEAAIEKAYLKSRSKMNIPGFRPGKAPRKMIEKMYGVEVFYDEAINIALPDAYMAAITETKSEPVGYPEVELLDVSKDGFSFKATFAQFPEVKLGQYKGLKAVKPEVKVSAEDVKERLNALAERNSRLESVDRKCKKGDIAVIDFEGFDHGKPFQGGKGENFDLELGSGSFVPGFEDQVVGMKAGEEKDIDITFPENYHADLAGKAVVFHVKVNEVKVKELPKLDDEFAKDVSEFDTLAELKADLKKKVAEEREGQAKQVFEDNLMKLVADGIECDVPQVMIDEQAQHFVENFKNQIQSQGIKFDEYAKMTGITEESLRKEAQEPALRQVRLDLAMDAIVKAEKIEVSDEDVAAEYERMATQYGMKAEDLKKYISDASVRAQLINSKAIAVVVDSAKPEKPKAAKEESEAEPAAEKPAKKTSKKAGKEEVSGAAEEAAAKPAKKAAKKEVKEKAE